MVASWAQSSMVLSGPSSELESHTLEEVKKGLGVMLVSSTTGKEWICYQSAVAGNSSTVTVGQVQRGLFGTVPLAHPAGARVWAVSEGYGVTSWQYLRGESVSYRMLTRTQTGSLGADAAALRTYNASGSNVSPWPPGRVKVNGTDGGQISAGTAKLTWRKRDGALPAVVFFSDDVSQATDATYKIVVKAGSSVVRTVTGVAAEEWSFTDETAYNSGQYFGALTFEISAQKLGFADSPAVVISITR